MDPNMLTTAKRPVAPGDLYARGGSVFIVAREAPRLAGDAASGASRLLVREVTRWGRFMEHGALRFVRYSTPKLPERVVLDPPAWLAQLAARALRMEPRVAPDVEARRAADLDRRVKAFQRAHRGGGGVSVCFLVAGARHHVRVGERSLEAAKAAGDEAIRLRLAQHVFVYEPDGGELAVHRRGPSSPWSIDRKRTEARRAYRAGRR